MSLLDKGELAACTREIQRAHYLGNVPYNSFSIYIKVRKDRGEFGKGSWKLCLKGMARVCFKTATADSDVVQSGRPIFDDFFQHLWPYIGNNTANVVFQMVKRLWLIRIDQ
ncbi:hypothetical protein TNCV_1621701 [Trichonephila clavipes]|nr:hypothetical protein TNCV_1621701 [Trichonephila clavipes]